MMIVPLYQSDDVTTVLSCKSSRYDSLNIKKEVVQGELLNIDDAINRLGYGYFQVMIVCAAGLCFMADSMEIMLLSFLSRVLKDKWNLSSEDEALITASVFGGSVLGTLILGRCGDIVGRRPIFLVSASIISIFGFATAFTNRYETFLSTRFMVGFGVGGLTMPFDILAECLPTTHRGKYLLVIEFFWTAGSILVPIVAYFTIGYYDSWKSFVTVCALPCVISTLFGYFWVPESPRWLLCQGRQTESLAILRNAAILNGKDPDRLFPIGTILLPTDSEEIKHLKVANKEETYIQSLSKLVSPKWRLFTFKIWGLWAGMGFGYYGSILTITKIFGSSNASSDAQIKNSSFDYAAILLTSVSELMGTLLVIMLIDKIGRVPSIVFSYLLGGGLLLLLCYSNEHEHRNVMVCYGFLARMFEMMASCVTWVLTAELLPTELRTSGHSVANAISRVGAFISPFLLANDKISFHEIGIIMFIVHAMTSICAYHLPETSGTELGLISYDSDKESVDHSFREFIESEMKHPIS